MQILTRWFPSGLARPRRAQLPVLRDEDERGLRHWFVLTGGLALILSRARAAEIDQRFGATRTLYLMLHRRLKKRQPADVSAELLNDVLHEIASLADPLTHASAQACFRAAVQNEARQPAAAGALAHCSTRTAAVARTRLLAARGRVPPAAEPARGGPAQGADRRLRES